MTKLAEKQRRGSAVSMLLGVGVTETHVQDALDGTAWVVGPGVPICTATGARVSLWVLMTTFGPSQPRPSRGAVATKG